MVLVDQGLQSVVVLSFHYKYRNHLQMLLVSTHAGSATTLNVSFVEPISDGGSDILHFIVWKLILMFCLLIQSNPSHCQLSFLQPPQCFQDQDFRFIW